MKLSITRTTTEGGAIKLDIEGDPEDIAFILDITGNTVDFPSPSGEADDKETVH